MQSKWQQFLIEQGAHTDERDRLCFDGDATAIDELANTTILSSLDHFGIIRVRGDDNKSFLQGQLSNDINQLGQNSVQLAAYCNPKGRIFAQLLVVPHEQDILLLLPHETLDMTLTRLRMFVLRSAVTLEDVSDEFTCLGLIGNKLADLLINTLPPLPDSDFNLQHTSNSLIARIPGPLPRYLLIMPTEDAQSLWLSADAVMTTGQSVWHWCDIQAGLPSVWQQTQEAFVPQMLNLELIGGVNFKKGCYPGQEIVARMHYLGKAKRRMFRLQADIDTPPTPGIHIFQDGGDGQNSGEVVIAESTQQAGTQLLAVLQLAHLPAQKFRLGDPDGPELTLADLPYSLEPEQ